MGEIKINNVVELDVYNIILKNFKYRISCSLLSFSQYLSGHVNSEMDCLHIRPRRNGRVLQIDQKKKKFL